MANRDPIESALDRLGEIRRLGASQPVADELRRYLSHRSNLVVAKAAKVARELALAELLPDLTSAFRKFMADAPRLDKRCAAVTELATALYEFDYDDAAPFLTGLHHVQLEASFGPPVDEAAKLRAICAQGLLRTNYSGAMDKVVNLLVDREPAARIGAVRALAANGGTAGALLLRLKVLTGDSEPAVLGECFAGLLSAALESSVSFVAGFVDAADGVVAESAMLALGDSRLPAACAVLREKWARSLRLETRQVLLTAMAALRLDESIAFLIEIVESANFQIASSALDALTIYRTNDGVRARVEQAVAKREEKVLAEKFRAAFS